LVKISVERAVSMARITCGSSFRPMCPPHGKRSIVAGRAVSIATSFGTMPSTMRASCARPGPTRHAHASCRFASVAERPQVRRAQAWPRSRANASSTCTPRFVDMSSCHSSTTTAWSFAKRSRQSARDSMSDRLSGVVTRIVGSSRACRERSALDVSPVRAPTVQCGCSACAARASASVVSCASARSGVIHSSVSDAGRSAVPAGPSASGPISAASVLPMPVGAYSNPERPSAYACHTASWNGNGVMPCARNQSRADANASCSRAAVDSGAFIVRAALLRVPAGLRRMSPPR